MEKFILGKKIEMNQIFEKDGTVVPVTIIEAGPCRIIQVKTEKKEGYNSIQIGFGQKKKIKKPLKGHLKDLGNFRYLKEFRVDDDSIKNFKIGDEINVNVFQKGDILKISGVSKGKGFAGVVKRHGFHGSDKTHGTKHSERAPGSIGSAGIQRVFKGLKMAGRMGGDRVTIKGLKVIDLDSKKNLLTISGAIPGARNGLLEISNE